MFFEELFDWTESWAPLIPISLFLLYRNQPTHFKPVFVYFIAAFLLNTFANVIWKRGQLGLDLGLENNNSIYNLNSILRFSLLSLFFILLHHRGMRRLKRLLPLLFLAFACFDLFLWEYFFAERIANNLHAAEAGFLLLYCLLYYFQTLNSDAIAFKGAPDFWLVTGLCIFVIISFPVYLFYQKIIDNYKTFTVNIWAVQKTGFLIFCIFSSIAFFLAGRLKLVVHG